jgi:ABC-type branched-subunit amino acid transport system ATPase component
VVTLVGTNGAGKTTTLRTISGLLKPESGEIWFEGKRIDTTPAHEVLTRGLAHSPEGRRIFPRLTVEDNLMLGAFARRDRAGVARTLSGCSPCSTSCGSGVRSRPALLRRRAADAGHRPVHDEPAEAADAG